MLVMENSEIASVIISTFYLILHLLNDEPQILFFLRFDDRRAIKKIADCYELVIPLFDDSNFQQQFRVSRSGCEHILSVIGQNLKRDEDQGRPSIAPEKKVLVFLSYISGASSCRTLSNLFGIGRSSVSRIIREVTVSIISNIGSFIKFPRLQCEFVALERYFDFPGAIGAIDGTHIRILAPSQRSSLKQ